jgi:hypothetical protein
MPRRLLYLLLLFIVACALLFMRLPIPPTYAARTIENAGHTPLFFLITLGVMYVARGYPWFNETGGNSSRLAIARLYAFGFVVGVGAGFLSEVIQRYLHRDASWEDVVADAIGAGSALAVHALFDRRSLIRTWHRVLAALVAVACFAVYAAPIVTMTRAYMLRDGEFPVLANFHSRLEMAWTMSFGVRREIVDDALLVEFVADDFPGVAFHEPVPDWRGFKTLVIDVQNPAIEPLKLGVRVHDRKHRFQYHDRYNGHFDLAAGERRTLRISLEDIRRAPRTRLMDMRQISDVTLYRGAPTRSRQLRVFGLRLE